MRNAVHHDFERDRDLLLDLFRGNSRPLRDNVDIVIRDIGISFYREIMKGNPAPDEQQQTQRQNQTAGC